MKKIILLSTLISSTLVGISILCLGMALSNDNQSSDKLGIFLFPFILIFICSLIFAIIEVVKKEKIRKINTIGFFM